MARGKKCPVCGHYMYAEKEVTEKQGTTVWYVCRNNQCKFTEKVFEPK
jgi:predicted nucleic-acid-binding Zn-ribbon protein